MAGDGEPSPGDGAGYPIPYSGERVDVDYEFLTKCRSLAPYSGAYRLNETTVIKTGEAVRMSEAAAMRLVAEKTSIPVPKILDAYMQERDGRGVILMEYIEGQTLDKAWPTYSLEQRQAVISQLRQFLTELRSMTSTKICAVDGSACSDQFFSAEDANHGPFGTEKDFNESLALVIRCRGDDAWSRMVSRFLDSVGDHTIVLTHNDLAPRNILTRDGSVVAILDWELSGFYPDYWEYVKAYLWADWSTQWITEGLPDQILTPKLPELAYLLHARDIVWT